MQVSDATVSANADTNLTPMPLVNHERVLEVIDLICEGEPAAFGRWVDYLEADIAKFASLVAGAGTTKSNQDILNAAHSLKGTCLNLGAPALGALFVELERHAKEGKWEALMLRHGEGRSLEVRSALALRQFATKSSLGA